jgi:hypothetical protein
VIEHNLEVIKTADWIIDLGPEGGDVGGEIVVAGKPEDVARHKRKLPGSFSRRCSSAEERRRRRRSEPDSPPIQHGNCGTVGSPMVDELAKR